MSLQIGKINKFIVRRQTDIAYTLYPIDDITTDVFLHFNEATKELKELEEVECFLYYDSKRRLCATMAHPTCEVGEIGFGEVVNVNERLGVFVNIGISKDILFSKDDLPNFQSSWPKVGEKLPIMLHVKKDSMTCKFPTKQDIGRTPCRLNIKDVAEATIISFNSSGVIAYTDDFDIIFIHKSMLRKFHHLGERIMPTIVGKNEHHEYNGSLIQQKELMMKTDAETILEYLKNMGGIAKAGNCSTPEDIEKIFHMSKGAFKRATGNLYKEHLITIDDFAIRLVNNEK